MIYIILGIIAILTIILFASGLIGAICWATLVRLNESEYRRKDKNVK